MEIPTPMLIEELKKSIPRTPGDNKVYMVDVAKVEKLMREAAAQLERFLEHTTKKEEQ